MSRFARTRFSIVFVAAAIATLAGCSSTRSTVGQIDDAAISASVKAKLAGDPEVKAHEIDVDTVGGVVTLTGKVDSRAVRAEAVKLARGTSGVRRVHDNLTVGDDPTTGEELDDAAITLRVKARLAEDPAVKARDIDVDTLEGVVTLTGRVESRSERNRAYQIAAETSGVRSVRNYLEVSAG